MFWFHGLSAGNTRLDVDAGGSFDTGCCDVGDGSLVAALQAIAAVTPASKMKTTVVDVRMIGWLAKNERVG